MDQLTTAVDTMRVLLGIVCLSIYLYGRMPMYRHRERGSADYGGGGSYGGHSVAGYYDGPPHGGRGGYAAPSYRGDMDLSVCLSVTRATVRRNLSVCLTDAC